jgi:hypothetical protein
VLSYISQSKRVSWPNRALGKNFVVPVHLGHPVFEYLILGLNARSL